MDWIEKYWAVVSANPLPFILLAIIVFLATWSAASIFYSQQVANAKAQADLAEKQRDDFKSKLAVSTPDEAKTKVDRLEGELNALNKLLSVTVGYEWPPLSELQINALGAKLAQVERKHRVQIMYQNHLGKALAQGFFDAFKKAGWTGATFSDGGGAHHGIIAGAGGPMASAIKDVIEATTSYKVTLDKPDVTEWGDLIYLFVGVNPGRQV